MSQLCKSIVTSLFKSNNLQESDLNNNTIKHYILTKELIGSGSFAKVYKGINTKNDKIVAIKEICTLNMKDKVLERLNYEITVMSKLNHKNIVKFYDYEERDGYIYIIMEYCENGTFNSKFMKKLDENKAQFYIRQLAEGLKYLRGKCINHRDLKPDNLLLTNNFNTLKITDFGFAKIMAKNSIGTTLCGSPLYMSPELLKNQNYTIKADLWSVGLIIYECIYKTHPYKKASNIIELINMIDTKIIDYNFKEEKNNNFSNYSIQVVRGLLQKDPKIRYTWIEFFTHPWINVLENELPLLETSFSCPSFKTNKFAGLSKCVIDNYNPNRNPLENLNNYKYNDSKPIIIENKPKEDSLSYNFLDYMTTSIELIKDTVRSLNSF